MQKNCKSRPLFLIQKTHQVIFAAHLELVMTHILHRKKIIDVSAENLSKITANVQKSWIRSQWGLIFCRMKILTMPRKKAQNSDAERGRLHGEMDVLKFQILFCKYLCTTWLLQILVSFRRVQLVPFSLLSWLRSVHFVPYKYKMRGKSI